MTAAHRTRPSRRDRSIERAGFTLIELTVALVAGLIVALGIVGLSKEATRTFQEEVRNSAAEATLRTAVDRLRADLARASYMSTPNIVLDPRIAKAPGATNVANINASYVLLNRLAGVHLFQGGSAVHAPLSASQVPALSPDALEIGGNMTCSDQYEIQTVQVTGACTRLTLSVNSPAVYRVSVVGPTAQSAEFNNLFQPSALSHQFMVRILDDTGRSQYMATCAEQPTAGFLTSTQAYVDVDTSLNPVLSPQSTQGLGGVSPTPAGRAWVNPVQVARWEITNAAPTQYQNSLDRLPMNTASGADANKYDLVRSYVDAKTGTVMTDTTEVVAEYAVDLKIALSVENGTSSQPVMLTYAYDDTSNQNWANNVSTVAGTQPERIRIVRARAATRAAQADRTINLPVSNYAVGSGTQAFMYRYCLVTPCVAQTSTLGWARARTVTTEVALQNQAGAFY